MWKESFLSSWLKLLLLLRGIGYGVITNIMTLYTQIRGIMGNYELMKLMVNLLLVRKLKLDDKCDNL